MWKVTDHYLASPITFSAVNASARLAHLTWTDIALRQRPPIIVIPVGATEQHGPHLPIATDTIIAEALADALIAQLTQQVSGAMAEPPCLIGPTLQVTASGEHQGFPGTVSLGNETTTEALVQIVRSADWAAGLLLVNGHGGNYAAVTAACEVLAGEQRTLRAWWPRIAGGDLHAGHSETSLMAYLRPDLVRVASAVAGPSPELHALRSFGVKALSPSGVLGDPRTASPEQGHAIFDALSHDLLASFRSWFADALPV
jgi:mycofactocin system creatininase family protein